MNLDFKKAFKDVFSLQYFWFYLLFFAVITTLSFIMQSAKVILYNNLISNIFSVFAYISTGYLFLMINNLLKNNNLNNENETFFMNLLNSTKKGLKGFVGILANTIFGFLIGSVFAIISVLLFIKKTHILINENNLFDFPLLNIVFIIIAVFLTIYMLFVLKLIPTVYSENFSLKVMFCWRKVFKEFFKKGKRKATLSVLGIYIVSILIIFAILFAGIFLFNLVLIFSMKKLLVNHYVLVAFLVNLQGVIVPFLAACFNFAISGIIFHLLSQIYKKNLENNVD